MAELVGFELRTDVRVECVDRFGLVANGVRCAPPSAARGQAVEGWREELLGCTSDRQEERAGHHELAAHFWTVCSWGGCGKRR